VAKKHDRKKRRLGNTRSEQHENMAKDGWHGAGLTPEQVDKCKYLEKKKGKKWYSIREIDEVK
jgi:hypothetical protein